MRVIQVWIMVIWLIAAFSFLDVKAMTNRAQDMTHPVPLSTTVAILTVLALLPVVSMQVTQALVMTLWFNIVSQFVDLWGLALCVRDMTKPLPLKTIVPALVVFVALPLVPVRVMQALVMVLWYTAVSSFVDVRTLLVDWKESMKRTLLWTQLTVDISNKSAETVEGEDATIVNKVDESSDKEEADFAMNHQTAAESPVGRSSGIAFEKSFDKTPATATTTDDAASTPAMVTPAFKAGGSADNNPARVVYQCPVEDCAYQVPFNKRNPPMNGDLVSDEERWGKAYKNQVAKMRSHYGKEHPEITRSDYPEAFAYGKLGQKRSADDDDEQEAPSSKQARTATDNTTSSPKHVLDVDSPTQSSKRPRRS